MAKLLFGDKHRQTSPGTLKLLWRVEAAMLRLLALIFRLLTPAAASKLGAGLARRYGPRLDKTRLIRRNINVAFPELDRAQTASLVADIWANLGSVLAEYPHLKHIARTHAAAHIEVVMNAPFEVFKLNGTPAVFVTAHLGNWEISAATIAQLGVPLTVVYTPLQNPSLDRMLQRARGELGFQTVARDGAARELMRCLKHGKSVGLIVDQRVDSGEMLPFFGTGMLTSVTPAQLALRFNCELIPVQVQRLPGARFRVSFHAPLRATDPAAPAAEQASQLSRAINQLFEAWIRERPQEWMCTKRRWPKTTGSRE